MIIADRSKSNIFKVAGALPYIDGTIPCPDKETDLEERKTWGF